jgi:hypothetical protein
MRCAATDTSVTVGSRAASINWVRMPLDACLSLRTEAGSVRGASNDRGFLRNMARALVVGAPFAACLQAPVDYGMHWRPLEWLHA